VSDALRADLASRRFVLKGLSSAVLLALAACGGGGGGDSSPAPAPVGGTPPAPVPPAPVPPAPPAPGLPPLSAALPRLRGTGIFPDHGWTDTSASHWTHVPELPQAGANVARLFIQPFDFQTGAALLPGESLAARLQASVAQWGTLIDWCLSQRMHVVLAATLDVNWPTRGVWPDDGRALWSDPSAQAEFVEAWGELAQQYLGVQGIVFDLLNEPQGRTAGEIDNNHAVAKDAWNLLHQLALAQVRHVDPDRWVIVQPVWGDQKNFADLQPNGDAKTVYSFHCYGPHYFTHQGVGDYPAAGTVFYPSVTQDSSFTAPQLWNKAALAVDLQPALDYAATHSVRMMVGEVGCTRAAPSADRGRWMADALSLAEAAGLDIVCFQYDGWGVPSDFAAGWAIENSSVTDAVLASFALNKTA
jgi:hypothetical protein